MPAHCDLSEEQISLILINLILLEGGVIEVEEVVIATLSQQAPVSPYWIASKLPIQIIMSQIQISNDLVLSGNGLVDYVTMKEAMDSDWKDDAEKEAPAAS